MSSSYRLLRIGTFYHSKRLQRVYIDWLVDLLLFSSAKTSNLMRMSTGKCRLEFNARSILQIYTLSDHITRQCDQIYPLEHLHLHLFYSTLMFKYRIYKGH